MDLTPSKEQGEFAYDGKLCRWNPAADQFEVFDIQGWRPETVWERTQRHWDYGGTVLLEAMVRSLVEPADWIMTGRDILDNPGDLSNYIGLLPFIPGTIKKVVKQGDKVADAVRSVVPRGGFSKQMLSQSKVIAKGSNIRDIDRLVQQYGGTRGGWVKKKGWDALAKEFHWYEHHGIGRVEVKPI